MEKNQDFVIVTAQTDDRFFVWETEIQINNLRKWNLSDKLNVLVYWEWRENKPHVNFDWLELTKKYPEVNFFFYKEDHEDLKPEIIRDVYKSVIRPFCLKRFWRRFPELKNKTVLYMDGDVIFTKEPPIDEWCKMEECLVSDTRGYLGVEYMRNKAKEVGLFEDHFINIAASIVNINPKQIIDNDSNCGGAQYILKGITAEFWEKVQEDCVIIKQRFALENQRHFQALGAQRPDRNVENAGIQSWCADMWAVLYNLYYFDKKVLSPESMRFTWSTDPIENTNITYFLHNAGVGPGNNTYLFDKSRYRWGQPYMDRWPWQENLDYVSKDYASYLYAQEIKDTYKDKLT